VHRFTHAQPRIDSCPGEQIHGGQVLGYAQWVFPAQRGYRGSQLDPGGAVAGGGHHRDGGGDSELQMAVAHQALSNPSRSPSSMIRKVDSWPEAGSAGSNRPKMRNPSLRKGREGSGMGFLQDCVRLLLKICGPDLASSWCSDWLTLYSATLSVSVASFK
jgi:hypothetical protein